MMNFRVLYYPINSFVRNRDWVFSSWKFDWSWGFTILGMTFSWEVGRHA